MNLRSRCASLALTAFTALSSTAGDAAAQTPTSPYLLGDWHGQRSALADDGLRFKLAYTGEAAHNVRGGSRELTRYTDQWQLNATLDLDKLWRWHGATFQLTYTSRHGDDLGAEARIGNYQLIQEVYGRGQTVHLTDLWLEQAWLSGQLAWKLGRMTVGEDFASFSCDFQNLTFCGAQPGNLVGDYWVNWPTSVWATRLKLATSAHSYVQLGAYQVNPHYVDDRWARHNGWKPDNPGGTLGVLVPLEFGWTPTWRDLPGSYKLGAWYSNARVDDLVLDRQRQPRILSGQPALQHEARYGGYINFQQQVSGDAGDVGATLFLNLSQADHRSAATDRQLSLGVTYRGPLHRADDLLGFALGATHTNSRLARAARLFNAARPGADRARRGDELVGELFYSWSARPWLSLRPNLQYIRHPGGDTGNSDAWVLGLKNNLVF